MSNKDIMKEQKNLKKENNLQDQQYLDYLIVDLPTALFQNLQHRTNIHEYIYKQDFNKS